MRDLIHFLRAQHRLLEPSLADILCGGELGRAVRTNADDPAQTARLAIAALAEFSLDPMIGETQMAFCERRDGQVTFRLAFDRIGYLLGEFSLDERLPTARRVIEAVDANLDSDRFRRVAIRNRVDRKAREMLRRAQQRGLWAWRMTMSECGEVPGCDECRGRADAVCARIIDRAERRILRFCLRTVSAGGGLDGFSSAAVDLLIDAVCSRSMRRRGIARAA